MHLLLWIKGAFLPQDIHDEIMDPESDFQKAMVEYLEAVHKGEFFNGKMEDVMEKIDESQKNPEYIPPTKTMPEAPPPHYPEHNACEVCDNCKLYQVGGHSSNLQLMIWSSDEIDIMIVVNLRNLAFKRKSVKLISQGILLSPLWLILLLVH